MKRWIAGILILVCLAPIAMAEQPDDELLLGFYNDSVFFGDSITKALRRYRSAVRQTDPDFMPTTVIICTDNISLFAGSRNRLTGDYHFQYRGRESTMYDITAQINPKKVFILLGLNDPAGSKIEKAVIRAEWLSMYGDWSDSANGQRGCLTGASELKEVWIYIEEDGGISLDQYTFADMDHDVNIYFVNLTYDQIVELGEGDAEAWYRDASEHAKFFFSDTLPADLEMPEEFESEE